MSDSRSDGSLGIFTVHLDGHVEVALVGELDAISAPGLCDHLDRLVADGHRDIRLDFSALTFLDAGATGVLITYRKTLAGLGGRLRIRGAAGGPLTVLTLFDLLDTFDLPAGDRPRRRGGGSRRRADG